MELSMEDKKREAIDTLSDIIIDNFATMLNDILEQHEHYSVEIIGRGVLNGASHILMSAILALLNTLKEENKKEVLLQIKSKIDEHFSLIETELVQYAKGKNIYDLCNHRN